MQALIVHTQDENPLRLTYQILRDGTRYQLHPHGQNRLYIALDNCGLVMRYQNQWVAATENILGKLHPVEPLQPVRVPYEYCNRHPWHHHTLYEFYPPRQLSALRQLLSVLATQYPDLQVLPVHRLDPSRSDPHPQPDLLRHLHNYR